MFYAVFIRRVVLANVAKVKMLREKLPISVKILDILYNICATAPDLARSSKELAQVMQLNMNEVERILDNYGLEGYAESFTDNKGKKRYYVTERGIKALR